MSDFIDDDTEFDEPGEPRPAVDAPLEDAYWAKAHRRERYYRPHLDYEHYAPAYCVGYIGYSQYGGSFEDAERSLCANWERIKGDSHLAMDDALQAMRAAWDRRSEAAARPGAVQLRGQRSHVVVRSERAQQLQQ